MRAATRVLLALLGPALCGFRWDEALRRPPAAEVESGARESLARAMDASSAEVRLAAADGLARACGAEGNDALVRHLDDEDEHVRQAVVRAVGRCGTDNEVARLLETARDPSPGVRAESLRAISERHPALGVSIAIDAITDEHDEVVLAAAEALAVDPSDAAVEALATTLTTARSLLVIDGILAALLRVGTQASASAVVDAMQTQPTVRTRARTTLPRVAATLEAGIPHLARALSEKLLGADRQTTNAVIGVLADLAQQGPLDVDPEPISARFGLDNPPSEDLAAVFAAAGGDGALLPLLRLLDDERPSARAAATAGLERLSGLGLLDAAAAGPVTEAFRRTDGATRERLFSILCALRSPDAAELAFGGSEVLGDDALATRLASLRRHGLSLATRDVEPLLRHAAEAVRAEGFASLAATEDAQALSRITSWFGDPAPIDRVSLAAAMRAQLLRDGDREHDAATAEVISALLRFGSAAQRTDAFVMAVHIAHDATSLRHAWRRGDAAFRSRVLSLLVGRRGEAWVRLGLDDPDPRVRAAALLAARETLDHRELSVLAEARSNARFPENIAARFVLRASAAGVMEPVYEAVMLAPDGRTPRAGRLVALAFANGSELVVMSDAAGRVTLRNVPKGRVTVSDPFAGGLLRPSHQNARDAGTTQ